MHVLSSNIGWGDCIVFGKEDGHHPSTAGQGSKVNVGITMSMWETESKWWVIFYSMPSVYWNLTCAQFFIRGVLASIRTGHMEQLLLRAHTSRLKTFAATNASKTLVHPGIPCCRIPLLILSASSQDVT